MTDRVMYFTRLTGNAQIQMIIEFAGRLDTERLARAIRLSLEAEPILGCRFIRDRWRPQWLRIGNLDSLPLLELEEKKDSPCPTSTFLEQDLDPVQSPQLKGRIFRGDRDTLCLKISHLAADAGAMKEVTYQIAETYRLLDRNAAYRPRVNVGGSRSLEQIHRRFSRSQRLRMLTCGLADDYRKVFPPAFWSLPYESLDHRNPVFLFRHFGKEHFVGWRAYAHAHGATLHDMFLAACFRALEKTLRPRPGTPLRLMTTVDLRRYLPEKRGEAICNLLSLLQVNLGPRLGKSFEETLSSVHIFMEKRKKARLGLDHDFFGHIMPRLLPFRLMALLLERSAGKTGLKGPLGLTVTNMGPMDHRLLNFGHTPVTAAYLVTPLSYAPFFTIGWSGYAETLTMSTGYCRSDYDSTLIQTILDLIEAEMPQ
ncbi:MAG: hypothetical protein ACMUIA_04555 [bacterium]